MIGDEKIVNYAKYCLILVGQFIIRRKKKMKKRITFKMKQCSLIFASSVLVGGGIIFAYETIGLGLHIINLINAEKLP